MRNVHKIMFRKPEEKRRFGRPRRRQEDNTEMTFEERV
jgi:hypothetical protein